MGLWKLLDKSNDLKKFYDTLLGLRYVEMSNANIVNALQNYFDHVKTNAKNENERKLVNQFLNYLIGRDFTLFVL